ncbi:zinc-dependent alcohol dehydrogenase family protein [Azospirillum sp. B4]|uniref:zinc-dependent alcohol dehydrogenase family protein n=1 Tax=Azospirillum sp. B4 TaxID=95605 RepID=UPI00034B267B|nr:zinc-dependent alcohol dehydrogenase family protein [Azospirillum sp. B4]
MPTMKAAIVEVQDGPFRVTDVARPQPAAGQALVRIHASGVNPLDTKIRAGAAAHARHPLPAILGLDMAGVVVAVGPGVTAFRPGDEVHGMTGGVGGLQGALAQYAAVDADLLAPKPANLTMREAAALPLAVITAWEGLVDRAKVRAGQTLLVQGGAGGVGTMAVQIGLALGARVYATASAEDGDYIRSLGATPIDYARETVADYAARLTGGQGFELVYDTNGGAVLDDSFQAVARFGHVVSALGWGSHALAPLSFKGATYSGVFTLAPLLTGIGRAHHGQILTVAAALVEAGKLLPRLDPRAYTLDTAADAHAAVTGRSAKGKVVITVD